MPGKLWPGEVGDHHLTVRWFFSFIRTGRSGSNSSSTIVRVLRSEKLLPLAAFMDAGVASRPPFSGLLVVITSRNNSIYVFCVRGTLVLWTPQLSRRLISWHLRQRGVKLLFALRLAAASVTIDCRALIPIFGAINDGENETFVPRYLDPAGRLGEIHFGLVSSP